MSGTHNTLCGDTNPKLFLLEMLNIKSFHLLLSQAAFDGNVLALTLLGQKRIPPQASPET